MEAAPGGHRGEAATKPMGNLCDELKYNDTVDGHYYYSERLQKGPFDLKHLRKDYTDKFANFSAFELALNQEVQGFPPDGISQVWLGSENVTTKLHMDIFDNFYIQLMGTKRFVLADASKTVAAHLYPISHANARQSQLNITSTAAYDMAKTLAGM